MTESDMYIITSLRKKLNNSFSGAWAMGRVLLYSLCVLCVLWRGIGTVDYCQQLRELKLETGRGSEIPERVLSIDGRTRILKLCAQDSVPTAARAIIRALIVHGLRYRELEIVEEKCTLQQLQDFQDDINLDSHVNDYFVLSIATAWRDEGTSIAQCSEGACGLAGSRLEVLGRGAAPVARRLLARLAPGAPFHCLQSWEKLREPECGFIDDFSPKKTPCSEWTKNPCSGECVTVAIEGGDYEEEQCELAQELAKVTDLPLRLTYSLNYSIEERADSSYLLFDFDILMGSKERIWPAPFHPNLTQDAASLSLGDVRRLLYFAPAVLNLAYRFQPPASMLRRVLDNNRKLGIDTAACKTIVESKNSQDLARSWITCNDKFCDLKPEVFIYVCEAEENKDKRYDTIRRIVKNHWLNITNRSSILELRYVEINCSLTDVVRGDLENFMTNYEYVSVRGVVAMGSAGASSLPKFARESAKVPLVLVAPPPSGVELASARITAASAAALAAAVRALLADCKWRRVALLREEGRCDVWKRSLGVAEALNEQDLVVYQDIVQAHNVTGTLDALQTHDARIVVIDASAGTAWIVLATAEKRGLTMEAGFVWIVIGAAGDTSNSDWLPTTSEFSYFTVSGGWRGGQAPNSLLPSSTLRDALDNEFPRWPPHTSALVDAILLMLEGTTRLEERHPELRDDPHRPGVTEEFKDILDNITVQGVTHDIHKNSAPPVFTHRWSKSGAQLVGAWNGQKNIHVVKDQLCGKVLDGPGCYTTRSGNIFNPHCHDFAWVILVCALAFGLPSLYAARAARRRRLQLRDRAVEERVLLRGGQSAAEAAAGAALAEHAVPREALQLLDKLGTGHYGVVHQAVLRRPNRAALGVAVKAPRPEAPVGAAAELLREAALLATLKHDHVVRFTGVCWEGGPLVLMEHAFYGDLRRYLRARRTLAERARAGLPEPEAAHVAAAALTRLAREAASALGYLAHQRLVHRDVRAANCLIDVRRCLKLADFGMARRLDSPGKGEYLCKRRAMFPVLWMAPESLSRGVFSAASDVWALGVLLLELATLGERPYGAWITPRVLRHVREGGAPPLPPDAVPSTRGITAACWHRSPEERPSAAEIVAYLADHPRAIQPALEPYADADTNANAAPDDVYIDEWTVN
ncbi:uncharacterized protein LOC125227206 [Leguminivora glycinivorella]|uniref:uncharacterized protein LOC125227206 n=1 Tax=Leguminivora glycinivorella TaxID=1035111 RepID=UPI00200E4E00|nr:uncharacterized protein LOC125227206 [Leguminivora glycinivorella]